MALNWHVPGASFDQSLPVPTASVGTGSDDPHLDSACPGTGTCIAVHGYISALLGAGVLASRH